MPNETEFKEQLDRIEKVLTALELNKEAETQVSELKSKVQELEGIVRGDKTYAPLVPMVEGLKSCLGSK